MAKLPLRGVRVIDLGVVLAGPEGALHLADLGAEVIRVESTQYFPSQTRGIFARPPKEVVMNSIPSAGGYPMREPGERPWNRFAWFNTTARNKLGMTVDLRKAKGVEIVKRLVAISDVLITNQTPGVMTELGVGYDVLNAVNPRLIYVEASSFGTTGPYRNYRALGLQMEAFAGHDHLRHYRDRDVSSNTWAVNADASGALSIALAAQMALYGRERTGVGQYIDISMVENFVQLIGPHVLEYTFNGHVPESLGNRNYSAIQGCYPCAGDDRWLTITLPDDDSWERFRCAAAEEPAFAEPRFATVASRYQHHDELDRLIAGWTAKLDRDEAVERLRKEGIMAGPVLDDADAVQDRHLNERGFFLEIDQVDTGRHRYPGFPYRFKNAELGVRHPPVRLGEHNEYIYRELLGISEEEYAELEEDGHIGMDYAPEIP